jgi:predicted DNA-binding protein (UPF0251 family)
MTYAAAIATKLNVLESAIVRIEEWASVLFVVVKGLGGRFVSKKVGVKKMTKTATVKYRSNKVVVTILDGKSVSIVTDVYKDCSLSVKFATLTDEEKAAVKAACKKSFAEITDVTVDLSTSEITDNGFTERPDSGYRSRSQRKQDWIDAQIDAQAEKTHDLEYEMYNPGGRYYG